MPRKTAAAKTPARPRQDPLRIYAPDDGTGLKFGQEVYIRARVNRVHKGEGGEETVVTLDMPVPDAFATTGRSTVVIPLSEVRTEAE